MASTLQGKNVIQSLNNVMEQIFGSGSSAVAGQTYSFPCHQKEKYLPNILKES